MVSFKLCISEPSTGRTFQKEVKDNLASPFMGLNLGETIKGDAIDVSGYEFQITGGSDYCGFPMRKGILGMRKKIAIYGGVGFRGGAKGIKRRKTVCGHKIHERISQINLKVTKQGPKNLAEIFGVPDEAKKETKEEKKQEHKEPKAEAKEEKKEAKEHKAEVHKPSLASTSVEKKEEKKEAKEHKAEAKEDKKEESKEHKAEEKHEKPKEHKEEKKE